MEIFIKDRGYVMILNLIFLSFKGESMGVLLFFFNMLVCIEKMKFNWIEYVDYFYR